MSSDPVSVTPSPGPETETDQLRQLLREVIDPELGIDIVSLGLIYLLDVNDRVASVVLTTTTPACPLGDYLTDEVTDHAMVDGERGAHGIFQAF